MDPAGDNIIDLIEQQAELRPDWPAVISRGEQTSYRELMDRVKSISALVTNRSAGIEAPVGVCTERSPSWVAAMLGVLHSGRIYVPINPAAPLQRKVNALEEMGIRLLLVDRHNPAMSPLLIDLEVLDELPRDGLCANSRPGLAKGQAAYAIATSGSTGNPKMVIASHSSLWRYGTFLRAEIGADQNDRYLQTASLEFSASIRQVIAPLISGATLILAPQEEILDPTRLVFRMLKARVTILDTVPSYLRRWLTAVWEVPVADRQALAAHLKSVLTTGEPLMAETVNSLRAALPGVQVFNLYGQTETTGTVAFHRVTTPATEPIPIGCPAPDSTFYVLDEELRISTEGELCISGPCLARYHTSQSEASASAFLSSPFSQEPGLELYRTGDRVRSLGDGTIQFVGRTDRQVKFHGIRIDLGEIEAALRRHPSISEVAVVVTGTETDQPGLAAFAALSSNTTDCSALELRAFLHGILPDAVIPGRIELLDALPRTPSGKIDYPVLATRNTPTLPTRPASPPPSSATEQLVAACWEDVLTLTGVGVDDHFFALGGDSLQAIQMLMQVQLRMKKWLPLSAAFFEDPTVRAVAKAIDDAGTDEGA